jgi:sugar-phosphatase
VKRAHAVIFDMDGLLIDSEPLWVRAEIEVFGSLGVRLTADDCPRTKGLRVDDVVAYWHDQSPSGFVEEGRAGGVSLAEVEERLVGRVAELLATEGAALPGVTTALAAARSGGRPVALASSSPMRLITVALDRLGLARGFDVVHSAETEPYGKPHPIIFLSTAARLGVSPLDCIVVEDSLYGVIAAKAARMKCIAVPFDHPNHEARFALADHVVGSLEHLTASAFTSPTS